MDRATKAVATAGIERARIVMDLRNQRIEIIIGESGPAPSQPVEEWADDDI